jgi:hypothetical protein
MAARLVVRSPGAPRQDVRLDAPVTTIGRSDECDVVLDFNYISRLHARVERGDGGYTIVDNDSRNGTYVNGRRIAGPQRLASGDLIGIGGISVTFLDSAVPDRSRTLPLPEGCPIRCDESTREAWIGDRKVTARLSAQEFKLLLLLSTHYGTVCPRDMLAMAIWGEGNYEYNMLHRLVHRLKQKLGDQQGVIRSVPGVGYAAGFET